jgi:hypothetical protein
MDDTTTLPLIDGCPQACGNTETPRDTAPVPDAIMASYLCSSCGHAWSTDWRVA